MSDQLRTRLKHLSTRPGVYEMLNTEKEIIYVGKAKNLKKRVSSYFRKNIPDRKTRALMLHVSDFNTVITANENEALLLEAQLIKEHRPRYNVLLRDDKSYPYLYLSEKSTFPRLKFYRGALSKKGRYFGPYPNARAVHETLNLIQKLFKIRQCSNTFFKHRTRPCLQYQIGRCSAPCVDYVTESDYAEQVHHAVLFLSGKEDEVINALKARMTTCAQEKDYEGAAAYRDQIQRLRGLQEKNSYTKKPEDVDIISCAESVGKIALSVVSIRRGRLIGSQSFFPQQPNDTSLSETFSSFLPQYYLNPARSCQLPEKIILPQSLPDKEWIAKALQSVSPKKIKLIDHPHKRYQPWLVMAKTNAEHILSQRIKTQEGVYDGLRALQEFLGLLEPITRIECFDISHTQGEATTASCVVCEATGIAPQQYRRFSIKNITPGDDYAAMHQALFRRYSKRKENDKKLPDVIFIDGGKGQLKEAVAVLESLQLNHIALLGIAKGVSRKAGLERLFFADRPPARLDTDSSLLHFIQSIRDEAHRFAITGHRRARDKRRLTSPLEGIPGIGATRRQRLLQHFAGLQGIKNASESELSRVSGISPALARRIYQYLHDS